jgi:hypothetical protein
MPLIPAPSLSTNLLSQGDIIHELYMQGAPDVGKHFGTLRISARSIVVTTARLEYVYYLLSACNTNNTLAPATLYLSRQIRGNRAP